MKGMITLSVFVLVLDCITSTKIAGIECPLENPPEDILLPHEANCTKFYKCDAGLLVEFDCPAGLNFNAITRQCDWPGSANCAGSNDKKLTTDEENECPLENPEVDILLPHETNCSKFYECDHGTKVEFDCPEGLHFNQESNQCDWPENVNCDNKNQSIPARVVTRNTEFLNNRVSVLLMQDEIQKLLEDKCSLEGSDINAYLRHESDCTKFYICDNGNAVEFDCPDGLRFNLDTQQCDWPENVNCNVI